MYLYKKIEYQKPSRFMIGETIHIENRNYLVVKPLVPLGRPNADLYLCTDEENNEFVMKYFYNQAPRSNIAYGIKNHFGRRRDGSKVVFNEIKSKCADHSFLVKHLHRGVFKGKWFIMLEYIPGEDLREFIIMNGEKNPEKVYGSIRALVETLHTWHSAGLALGDPHLSNALIQEMNNKYKVTLIDYSLFHHADFFYCQQYNCFSKDSLLRIREDIANTFGNLGAGFRTDLVAVEAELELDNRFSRLFDNLYHKVNL